jgi:hypothetical protein
MSKLRRFVQAGLICSVLVYLQMTKYSRVAEIMGFLSSSQFVWGRLLGMKTPRIAWRRLSSSSIGVQGV